MITRREFIERSLASSTLLALGGVVPQFVSAAGAEAKHGHDKILVVLEMTGGNDGLNTVVPYGDDLYYKARPTLGILKSDILKIDEHIGLNKKLAGMHELLEADQLAVIQGVGYPNPNRSHFESMDVWQSGDPARQADGGWLGRTLRHLPAPGAGVVAFQVGERKVPLVLRGAPTTVPTIGDGQAFQLYLAAPPSATNPAAAYAYRPSRDLLVPKPFPAPGVAQAAPYPGGKPAIAPPDPTVAHRKLLQQLAGSQSASAAPAGGMLQFVQRTSLDTYALTDRVQQALANLDRRQKANPDAQRSSFAGEGIGRDLALVAQLIQAGLGTRIFYVAMSGYDTHSGQRESHDELLGKVDGAVKEFFATLKTSGDDKRVLLLTYSEFGRRTVENGSGGTDHGAASCLLLAGPGARSGLIGMHPSLKAANLEAGDLRYQIDFRRVYATLLDRWLECDSRRVLGEKFEQVGLLKA